MIAMFAGGNEHVFLGFDLDDGLCGNGEPLFALGAVELDLDEHPQLEQARGIIGLGEDGDGACLRVDHGADREQPGRELAIRVTLGGQAERRHP